MVNSGSPKGVGAFVSTGSPRQEAGSRTCRRRLKGRPSASILTVSFLRAEDWWVNFPEVGAPQLRSGQIAIDGIAATWFDRGLRTPWRLIGHVEEGVLFVDALSSGPVALAGSLRPDPWWKSVAISLAGRVDLGAEILGQIGVPETYVSDLKGDLVVKEFHAVLPTDPNVPPGIRAYLRNGAVSLAGGAFRDSLTGINLDLTTTGTGFEVAGRARSTLLGDLELSATRGVGSGPIYGAVSFDAAVLIPELSTEGTAHRVAPLLREYGRTHLRIAVELPQGRHEPVHLRVECREAPSFFASIALPTGAEGPWLGDASVEATLPASAIDGAFQVPAMFRGEAALRVLRRAGDDNVVASLDCAALGVKVGDWIDKGEGESLVVTVRGDTTADAPWATREISLASRGDRVRFLPNGDQWEATEVGIDLAQ